MDLFGSLGSFFGIAANDGARMGLLPKALQDQRTADLVELNKLSDPSYRVNMELQKLYPYTDGCVKFWNLYNTTGSIAGLNGDAALYRVSADSWAGVQGYWQEIRRSFQAKAEALTHDEKLEWTFAGICTFDAQMKPITTDQSVKIYSNYLVSLSQRAFGWPEEYNSILRWMGMADRWISCATIIKKDKLTPAQGEAIEAALVECIARRQVMAELFPGHSWIDGIQAGARDMWNAIKKAAEPIKWTFLITVGVVVGLLLIWSTGKAVQTWR